MNATLYYHLRSEKTEPVVKCVAKPATSEHDVPYYELHLGDAVMFVDDGLCRRILDVLASRPELPKTDAEPECTCVLVGDMADATGCEVHRKGGDDAEF